MSKTKVDSKFTYRRIVAKFGTSLLTAGTSKLNQELDFGRTFTLSSRQTVETDPNSNRCIKLYDDKFRVTRQSDHLGNNVDIIYDGDNGPSAVTDARGAKTQYTYDAHGNVSMVVNPDNTQQKLYYDSKDNLIAVRDAAGNDTAYGYDNNSRLAVIYHNATLNFDASDNLAGWQYDTTNTTTFSYDPNTGHLLSITNPEGRKQLYEQYNSSGLPCVIKSTSGFAINNTYDSLSRLKSINDPAGNSISFTYNNADQIETITTSAGTSHFEYDPNNNLVLIKDAKTNSTDFTYDSKNNLESVLDAESGTTGYVYDKFNNLTEVNLPNITKFGYEFDDSNRLVVAKSGMGEPVPVIAVLVDTLDMGNAVLGSSATKKITIYNIGNKQLNITGLSFDNNVFSSHDTTASIAPGENSDLNIIFTPDDEGQVSAILTVNSDDVESPDTSVNITGTGQLLSIRTAAISSNDGVSVSWYRYSSSGSEFDHYSVYRSTSPITSVSGLTPVTTITDINTTSYLDNTATLGAGYYYSVVAFSASGKRLTAIDSFGPAIYLNLGRVGNPVDINSNFNESNSSVTYNSTQKEYLLVYKSKPAGSGTNYDILGQRISDLGEKIGSPFAIFDSSYSEYNPRVVYNSVNNEYMIVAEMDLSGNGTHCHVVGQRMTGSGTRTGSWFYILETSTQERNPRIAFNSTNNNYAITMEYDKNGDGTRQDIISCLYSSSGSLLSYSSFASTNSNYQLYAPNVIYNSVRNEYLYVLELVQVAEGKRDIYYCRTDSANTPIDANLSQISYTGKKNYSPKLAYNPSRDEYVCIWHYDINNDGKTYSLALTRIRGSGGMNVLKVYSIPEKSSPTPEICYFSGHNEYLVSFTTNKTNTTEFDVEAQRMSGVSMEFITPLSQLIPVADTALTEKNNCLALNPDRSEFLSAYAIDLTGNGSNYDIKAYRIGTLTFNLSVDPVSLAFGNVDIEKAFRVINTGGAPMHLLLTSDQPWLSLNSYEINTPLASANFTAYVSREGVAPDNYSGNIHIEYGSGALNLPVTMTVSAKAPDAPSAPVPADQATNQADIGQLLTVTMGWTCTDPDIGDALTYDIYLGTDYNNVNNSDASCLAASNKTQNSYKSSTLEYHKTYYWRIKAKDKHSLSTLGPVWSFTTANLSAPKLINYATDPTNNKRPKLEWQKAGGATKYHLQVSADLNFTSFILNESGISNLFYALASDLPEGKIYWRVSSLDDSGNESSFSETDDFTVQTTAPGIPVLIDYVPNPTKEQKPTLSWKAVDGAASYHIQINNAPDFTNPLIDKTATLVSYTPENNLPEGTIFWRVSSKDAPGNESEFSSPSSFKIDITAPDKITGLGSEVTRVKVTLSWSTFNNKDADFRHFNIYRSETKFDNVSSMTPVSETITDPDIKTYVDSSVTENKDYYYAATAEDSLGNENKSVTAIGPVTPKNQPPVLAAVGNKTVNEGQLLEFAVSATDPENDDLVYSATGLPEGAYFSAQKKTFSWIPGYNQSASYAIHFEVSDGSLTDSEDITVTVNNTAVAPASGGSVGVRLKVRVI
ncbi:MAG: choice-of-anchor D domain-containing protein [Candidatus Omnitrophica bacterium]|nr:choice-of-anchor D domain-containing protein [Candidatus Omnitrophota bacterium]